MPNDSEAGDTERRRARRFPVEREHEAFVQIVLVGRSHWKLNLVEISSIGVAFRLTDGRPSFTVGTRLDGVSLHMLGHRVLGRIHVAHITRGPATDTICGAEFHPSTESDQRTMALLLSSLEQRSPQPG
jgi:hypothetical protein